VECVIIPWEERGASTLCVSSQVGCRQGCTFCATGRMGIIRSLTSDEILAQLFYARKITRLVDLPNIDNVVFMGMGEPSDNIPNVVSAANAMVDPERFAMAQTKVTISTVAPNPDVFENLCEANCAVAWSVHAVRDGLRKKLVPTTRHTMVELREGYIAAMSKRSRNLRTTMLEFALIDGVNDADDDADAIVEFVRVLYDRVEGIKVVVNLIPFNDIGHPTFRKPSLDSVRRFQNRLVQNKVFTYVRTTRGDDESAACGQLATKRKGKVKVAALQDVTHLLP